MPHASPNVRIQCQSPQRAEAARAGLAAEGILSNTDHADLPDVVVTDAPWATALAEYSHGVLHVDVGVVSLAGDEEADVALPTDATPRELAIACRLLAEIVHLRRQERQHAAHEHELEQLAYLDPLTELANRRAWDNELTRRIARLRGGGPPFCLAPGGCRSFQGHQRRARPSRRRRRPEGPRPSPPAHVRDRDVVARLGGDEFGLLLEHVTPGFAAEVVDRIRAAALVTAAGLPEPRLPFTASAGYCCAEATPTTTPESLYAVADRGLAHAKATGRNRTASSDGLA